MIVTAICLELWRIFTQTIAHSHKFVVLITLVNYYLLFKLHLQSSGTSVLSNLAFD